jgi:hypothetical protein
LQCLGKVYFTACFEAVRPCSEALSRRSASLVSGALHLGSKRDPQASDAVGQCGLNRLAENTRRASRASGTRGSENSIVSTVLTSSIAISSIAISSIAISSKVVSSIVIGNIVVGSIVISNIAIRKTVIRDIVIRSKAVYG